MQLLLRFDAQYFFLFLTETMAEETDTLQQLHARMVGNADALRQIDFDKSPDLYRKVEAALRRAEEAYESARQAATSSDEVVIIKRKKRKAASAFFDLSADESGTASADDDGSTEEEVEVVAAPPPVSAETERALEQQPLECLASHLASYDDLFLRISACHERVTAAVDKEKRKHRGAMSERAARRLLRQKWLLFKAEGIINIQHEVVESLKVLLHAVKEMNVYINTSNAEHKLPTPLEIAWAHATLDDVSE